VSDNLYDPSALADIEKFDAEYKPDGGISPGPESLPDGEYDFEITAATLTKTANKGVPLLRLMLRVIGGALDGRTLERPSFLDKQKGIDRLGADLVTLGFNAETWNTAHGKRFSHELVAALPRLAGVTFSGKKTTSDQVDKNGEPYHNIYINSLVRLTDMPQRQAASSLHPQPSRASWVPPPENGIFAAQSAAVTDDDIPF
jgi:hypothetical protein